MPELTEREEQEMFARAKAGDPEANYNMSMWALERAGEEPEEERWNRLAAKCLVKSAEAGYAPAKKKMAELMKKTASATAPEDEFDWSAEPADAAVRRVSQQDMPGAGLRAAAVGGAAIKRIGLVLSDFAVKMKGIGHSGGHVSGDTGSKTENAHSTGEKYRLPVDFSDWDDEKWRKLRFVCSIICVVLALIIGLMLVVSRRNGEKETEVSQIPVAATAAPVAATPTPSPVPYPDDATRQEIEAAELDIYPDDEDFLSEKEISAVSAGSGLKLRRGPNTSYGQILLMNYNGTVEVYAVSGDWSFVKYGDDWGWCSSDYLK